MTQKVYGIFPINQDPACLLKWGWSTIFFNSGSTASCHRTKKYAIDPDNFDQFHNLPEKIQDRKKMLSGQWPGNGCEYCRNVEDAGGESDRMMQLRAITDSTLIPIEIQTDANAVSVTPTMLEVYFSNICNQKCVYCGPHFSSQWEQENKKFQSELVGKFNDKFSVQKSQHNPYYDQMVSNLWKYLHEDNRYSVLKRFHIAGGEPFFIEEIDQCIDFWKDHPNPNLIISLITNLNVPHNRFLSYIERFRNLVYTGSIMTVEIVASIDAWGPEQEYTRFGIDLDVWQKNFEAILVEPWATVNINSALSALTIKQFPLLLEKINHWNAVRKSIAIDEYNQYITHSFNVTYSWDHLYLFDKSVFESDFEKILDLMPTTSQIQRNQKEAMVGIVQQYLQCKNNSVKIEQLKKYLTTLDFRRNTNWRETFPWLDQEFKE